ncbi:hypothetical protein [Actinoplanes sp. G11-F43]
MSRTCGIWWRAGCAGTGTNPGAGAAHLAKPFTVAVLGHAVRRLTPGAGA